METLHYAVPAPILSSVPPVQTQIDHDERPFIYLDSDDTLFDFHGQLLAESGIDARFKDNDTFWAIFNGSSPAGFFSRLKPFDGYEDFLDDVILLASSFGYDVAILTALSPRNAVSLGRQIMDKQECFDLYLRGRGFDIPAIYVETSAQKQNYSRFGDILIDDLGTNISAWRQKGGQGILHQNFDQSLSELHAVMQLLHPQKYH